MSQILVPRDGIDHLPLDIVHNPQRYSVVDTFAALRARHTSDKYQAYDHVLRGRVLHAMLRSDRHLQHPRCGQRQRGSQEFYDLVGAELDIGKPQIDIYLEIHKLPDALVRGRELTLDALHLMAKDTHEDLRELVAELAERRGQGRIPFERLREAARAGTAHLEAGTMDLAGARQYVLDVAEKKARLPGKGRKRRQDPPAPGMKQARAKMNGFFGAMDPLSPDEQAALWAEMKAKAREKGWEVAGPDERPPGDDRRNQPRGGFSGRPENEQKPSDSQELTPRKETPETRREEEAGSAPPDWHLPVLAAIRAGLDEDTAQELACQLCDIARGVDPSIYAQGLRDLWQRCGLEAAGVDRGHFDFYIGELVGPDWSTRGLFALGFLRLGTLPNYALLIHMLRAAELPEDLRAEVWQAGDEVPEEDMFDVPRTGPGRLEDMDRDLGIALRWIERMLPEVPKLSPRVQRDLCEAAGEVYMAICERYGPPPPEELQPRPMRF